MKIIPLKQGSDAWLEYRKNHIMATDASIIMCKNPWETPKDLWESKLSITPPKEINAAMLRGQDLEPSAREIACCEIGIDFLPCVVESDENPWQAASLDGLSTGGDVILEIKCPNNATHDFSVREQGIHNYYMCQMQHQMSVTGAFKAYYFSYRPEHETPFVIIEVLPDAEFIAEMVEAEKRFYFENLCGFKEPPMLRHMIR